MYRAELYENGKLIVTLSDTDNGDLEAQIWAKIAELNAAQQAANLFTEIRVCYV